MLPRSGYFYHHSAFSTAIPPAVVDQDRAHKRNCDWDKGALLVIAIVAIPTIIAAVIAIVLAM